MDIDFGRTAADYAAYRAGFPPELFDRLGAMGIGQPGQRVADVGTGTGTVARGFALRGCTVVGIDPSDKLLDQAMQLDRLADVSVDYRIATAEETGLADNSVDVYSAGQCWHWFDRAGAAREAKRILTQRGRLVICHFDWIPLPGNVVEATENLIIKHNPSWPMGGGLGMYPQWTVEVSAEGFVDIETFSVDVAVPYTHESWRGRIRASAGVAASLTPNAVAAFDAEHRQILEHEFAHEPLLIPHRLWALVARAT